jgi:hypothetical protein
MSITVIKPPACKNCEHWDPYTEEGQQGTCDLAYATKPAGANADGFHVLAPWSETLPSLTTGPDFYCCHFKQKEGE